MVDGDFGWTGLDLEAVGRVSGCLYLWKHLKLEIPPQAGATGARCALCRDHLRFCCLNAEAWGLQSLLALNLKSRRNVNGKDTEEPMKGSSS